jgi:hypothetical protein
MKKIVLLLIVGAVVAAPCIYDAVSTEPSPLAGAFALAAHAF